MVQKPGSFVHIEIASTDPSRTRRFFEDVFGWRFEHMPEMDYSTFEAPSAPPPPSSGAGGSRGRSAPARPPGRPAARRSRPARPAKRAVAAARGPFPQVPGPSPFGLERRPVDRGHGRPDETRR